MKTAIDVLLDRAVGASTLFNRYEAAKVQHIIECVAEVGEEHAEFYAQWAVAETGYGNVEDNVKKNLGVSTGLLTRYRAASFIEPRSDHRKNIIQFPKPAGVILVLVPSSNPVMTVYYAAMTGLMTRNVIVFSAHPKVAKLSAHVARQLTRAAVVAGAPRQVIQVSEPGIDALNGLMQAKEVDLILATGGAGRVRAAYRSGKPVLGMGPGNVPCYVHDSADIPEAAAHITSSNRFDHGLPCVCESVIFADEAIDGSLKEALVDRGGCFIAGEDEKKLRSYLFDREAGKRFNDEAIGKSASWIAERAGISVLAATTNLLVEIDRIGFEEPLSLEKLFPVMGYKRVACVEQAVEQAVSMVTLAGRGHSAVIHGREEDVVLRYAAALPVCRISVNTQGVEGAGGVSTHLTPGPMVGTGFFGGSSIDENLGPQHLVQWSRVGYPRTTTLPDVERSATEADPR